MTPNKRLLLGATLSLCVLSCGPATTEPADNQATETPDMSKATCDTDPPHDRCSASPDTYNDWSPSSIVSEIRFIDDDSCCFDIDGDGQNDNALGDLLEIAASAGVNIDGFNESVAQSIEDGTVALLAEHHHIAEEGGEFSINYYLGIPDGGFTAPVAEGGNAYKIDRGSLSAKGVWPSARMNEASHDGASVIAGPGVVSISTDLLGPPITLDIEAAQLTAEIDPAASDFDAKGIALTNGALGGAVRASEIFDAINSAYTENCGCAPIAGGEPFISYDVAALDETSCSVPDNDTSACEEDSLCTSIYDLCGFVGLTDRVVDIDADDPQSNCKANGTCNAISLGTTFRTYGAKITGITSAQ